MDTDFLLERAREYYYLMRFDRPIGTLLLLWPTLWALWIASAGSPDPLVAGVFVTGVVLMRAAGCVINDYADRGFDPHVSRTRDRPVAAGRVKPREALWLFVSLCLLAFGLVCLMNRMTVFLSVIGALLAASYPFMKRYTHWPQAYLGIAFGWAVPMVFAAQTGSLPPTAWVLYAATIMWTLAYDTMYGMVDREEDLEIGVKSTAILFGRRDRFLIAVIQTVSILMLLAAGQINGFSFPYYTGVAVAAGLMVYQQSLIAQRSREECFRAFLNNNWVGVSVFLGILIQYLF